MKAADICLQAADLVGGERAKQHGNLRNNFAAIAALWNGYALARSFSTDRSSGELKPQDVADMLELLKIARRLNGERNLDDYVDAAGYAGVAGALATPP